MGAYGSAGGGLGGSNNGGFLFHDYLGAYQAAMPYVVGTGAQPELFLPTSGQGGMAIPNIDQLLGGGGDTFNNTIYANSYAEGQAAADGFEDRIRQLRRSRK